MKILKQLAVVAFAAAVILTGCQNSFTGTDRDTGVLADINRSSATTGFTVTSVAAVGLINAKNQEITVTFSEAVDQSSILAGVTFRPVTDGAAATATTPATAHAYVSGVTITPTIEYVSGGAVTFLVDLSALTTNKLEVFVDSTKVTARNGALKMDLDGDTVKGEVNDDDYYTELTVGQSAITGFATITPVALGVVRNPRAGYILIPGNLSIVGAGVTSTNTYSTTFGIAAGDTTDYKAMLDGAITIEKYVPAAGSAGTWTAVAKSGSTYATATGVYVATFAATTEGDVLRVRITNPAAIVTTPAIQGFIQKTYIDNRDTEVLRVGPTKVSVTAAQAPKEIPTGVQATLSVTAVFDSNGLNGKIYFDIPVTVAGTKGIDTTSVTTSSIRIFSYTDNTNTTVSVRNYSGTPQFVCTDATNSTAVTRIILSLPAEYKNAGGNYGIVVTKDLKTLGDSVGTAVWARYFGDYENVNTLPEIIGSKMIFGIGTL